MNHIDYNITISPGIISESYPTAPANAVSRDSVSIVSPQDPLFESAPAPSPLNNLLRETTGMISHLLTTPSKASHLPMTDTVVKNFRTPIQDGTISPFPHSVGMHEVSAGPINSDLQSQTALSLQSGLHAPENGMKPYSPITENTSHTPPANPGNISGTILSSGTGSSTTVSSGISSTGHKEMNFPQLSLTETSVQFHPLSKENIPAPQNSDDPVLAAPSDSKSSLPPDFPLSSPQAVSSKDSMAANPSNTTTPSNPLESPSFPLSSGNSAAFPELSGLTTSHEKIREVPNSSENIVINTDGKHTVPHANTIAAPPHTTKNDINISVDADKAAKTDVNTSIPNAENNITSVDHAKNTKTDVSTPVPYAENDTNIFVNADKATKTDVNASIPNAKNNTVTSVDAPQTTQIDITISSENVKNTKNATITSVDHAKPAKTDISSSVPNTRTDENLAFDTVKNTKTDVISSPNTAKNTKNDTIAPLDRGKAAKTDVSSSVPNTRTDKNLTVDTVKNTATDVISSPDTSKNTKNNTITAVDHAKPAKTDISSSVPNTRTDENLAFDTAKNTKNDAIASVDTARTTKADGNVSSENVNATENDTMIAVDTDRTTKTDANISSEKINASENGTMITVDTPRTTKTDVITSPDTVKTTKTDIPLAENTARIEVSDKTVRSGEHTLSVSRDDKKYDLEAETVNQLSGHESESIIPDFNPAGNSSAIQGQPAAVSSSTSEKHISPLEISLKPQSASISESDSAPSRRISAELRGLSGEVLSQQAPQMAEFIPAPAVENTQSVYHTDLQSVINTITGHLEQLKFREQDGIMKIHLPETLLAGTEVEVHTSHGKLQVHFSAPSHEIYTFLHINQSYIMNQLATSLRQFVGVQLFDLSGHTPSGRRFSRRG